VIYSRAMPGLIRLILVGLSAVALALVVACGDDDEGETLSPAPTAAPTVAATPTAATVPAATPGAPSPTEVPVIGSPTPVVATPPPGLTVALLRDIRTEPHTLFDRIVFEFQGDHLPGYDVRFVAPPLAYDPSGEQMQIDGSAFLVIRMEPAAGHDPDTGAETYTGPRELKPGLASLLEAERVGDFEGVLTWALGLSAEVAYRVTGLDSPARLVIDIAH